MPKHDEWPQPAAGGGPPPGCAGTGGRTQRAAWKVRADGDGVVIAVNGDDRPTVQLIGELDLASAVHVRWTLPALSGRALVVDLSHLAFMDAAGLSALLLVRRQLEQTGRRLHLLGARGAVRRVFDLSGLGHLVEDAA